MIVTASPRERLDATIGHLEATGSGYYLAPIIRAVRDDGIGLLMIPQGGGRFDRPPACRPWVAIIGDDLDRSLGPGGFHKVSIRKLLKRAHGCSIVSSAAMPNVYAAAAAMAGTCRRNTVLIETTPLHELPWIEMVQRARPRLPILCCSVRGGTA